MNEFKIGDKSEDVRKFQMELNAQLGKTKGYVPLLCDSDYGQKTQDAVDLLESLTLKKGDTGEDVKDLQQKLNKLFAIAGLSIIDVDGIFGGATHDAVVEFQEKTFLKEDGIAGPKTMQALSEAIKATDPKETDRELGKRLEVHLTNHMALRKFTHGLAQRLSENFSPNLLSGVNNQLIQIAYFLDVERSERYQKKRTKKGWDTYCNKYAYDFFSFTWAHLPNVDWYQDAFNEILAGATIKPIYAKNCGEYSADMLFNWLNNRGKKYHGWTKVATAAEAQEAVNNGAVGLICADRRTKGKSGHITVILPGELEDGAPRQSQAGSTNRKDFHSSWYLGGQFLDYGFFVNYSPKI